MRSKIAVIALATIFILLVVALLITKKQGYEEHVKDASSISVFSNQVVDADQHYNSLSQLNHLLTQALDMKRHQTLEISNELFDSNAILIDQKSSIERALYQTVAISNQITTLYGHVFELQSRNDILNRSTVELSSVITKLEEQNDNTQNKLSISETNDGFIQAELQNQLAEKAELERKFNDLDEVRAQVRKLKDELFVTRRLQLERYDNGTKKGGAPLINHIPADGEPGSNYDLNVEVGSDGSVKVIPPTASRGAELDLEIMPLFPWPPPQYTCLERVPNNFVFNFNTDRTLSPVADRLENALSEAGYASFSFYAITNLHGFAMITQLEHISEDGKGISQPDRWGPDLNSRIFSVVSYLKALFLAPVGYYRVIVFVVSDLPFNQSNGTMNSDTAKTLLKIGKDKLAPYVASRSYDAAYECTAIIYEFKRDAQSNAPIFLDHNIITGDNLEQAGLLTALQNEIK